MSLLELTWIVYFIIAAINVIIYFTYFASSFNLKYSKPIVIGVHAICNIVICASFMLFENAVVNILVNVATLAVLIQLFKGNLKTRIIFAVFIYLATFVAEFVTALITVNIMRIQAAQIVIGTPEFLYGLLTSKVLFAIFARIISHLTKDRRLPKLSTMHWLSLIAPPIGSIFVLNNFLYIRAHDTIDVVSSVIVVIINLIAINVYDKILADVESDVKNKQLEAQVQYYSFQYFLAEESEKLISKTKHDIKNMLIGFQTDIHKSN